MVVKEINLRCHLLGELDIYECSIAYPEVPLEVCIEAIDALPPFDEELVPLLIGEGVVHLRTIDDEVVDGTASETGQVQWCERTRNLNRMLNHHVLLHVLLTSADELQEFLFL